MEFENSHKAGRIISVTVEAQKDKFIRSQYTPPQWKIFFDKLKCYVTPKYEVILGRDFNMVENLTMHRQGGNPNRQHQYRLEELNEMKQNCNLIDFWRNSKQIQNPIHIRKRYFGVKSRIDRFIFGTAWEKNLVSTLTLYPTLYQIIT